MMMMMMMITTTTMMMMRQQGVSSKPHNTCSLLRITITDVIFYSCRKTSHLRWHNLKILCNHHVRSCWHIRNTYIKYVGIFMIDLSIFNYNTVKYRNFSEALPCFQDSHSAYNTSYKLEFLLQNPCITKHRMRFLYYVALLPLWRHSFTLTPCWYCVLFVGPNGRTLVSSFIKIGWVVQNLNV
jgi:hypothetical protein